MKIMLVCMVQYKLQTEKKIGKVADIRDTEIYTISKCKFKNKRFWRLWSELYLSRYLECCMLKFSKPSTILKNWVNRVRFRET